ncbi:hypothetical protein TNCV_691281 [Trichonephila clavipes]|nr:hypothetical protein TNCV_691281 [Trichonephila clavipes]
MSPYALRKMIQKFDTIGQLGIHPGRGRKHIPSSSKDKTKWNRNLFRHRKTIPYAERICNPRTSTAWMSSRYNFPAGWCPSVHCKGFAKTAVHRSTGDQPSFLNSMVFSFAGYDSCDFWLWVYLKDNIYPQKPSTLPDLKDSLWVPCFRYFGRFTLVSC